MSNYTAKILGNAISALSAQQAQIANISNNIANVNTPGYSRRTISLETRSSTNTAGLNLGNGVQVGDIVRQADSFIESVLRSATSSFGASQVESDFLNRVEKLFSLTGETQTIGSTMTAFFGALDTLAADPSNLGLRAVVIERGQDVVNAIQSTYNGLASLQREADERLGVELQTVNSLTAQIAALNQRVSATEASGYTAADERDKRDYLIQQLSEKIGFSVTEVADGSVSITLPSGFPLVSGSTSRNLEATITPSFGAPPLPPSLSGGVLSYIVYDYGSAGTPAHVDLTQLLGQGGGTIGGLLNIRGYNDPASADAFDADGVLADLASRVESVTRDLLTRFNATYFAPDSTGPPPVSQAGDLSGNPPGIFGFFTFSGAVDDGSGVADFADLTGTLNFSSRLALAFTDPARLAAARDDDYGAAGNNPPYTFSPGDNQNLLALSALRTAATTFAEGSYASGATATYESVYVDTVTHLGNLATRADTNLSVAESNLVASRSRREEVSGVSLDEEYTNLIRFQKAYEASARLVRTATELLDEVMRLI